MHYGGIGQLLGHALPHVICHLPHRRPPLVLPGTIAHPSPLVPPGCKVRMSLPHLLRCP